MNNLSLYHEARPTIKMGDRLLYKGKGFTSAVIRRVTKSPYTHVGMVYESYHPSTDGMRKILHTFHASTRFLGDTGARLHLLSQVLRQDDGEVYVRRLRKPLSDHQKSILWDLRDKYEGTPYQQILGWQFVLAGWGFAKYMTGADTGLFCSELQGILEQTAGIMGKGRLPESLRPLDYANGSLDMIAEYEDELVRIL